MRNKTNLILLSPVVVSGFSWLMNQYWLMIISIIGIYFCIGITDASKHASIWLFVLAGVATIPINIELSLKVSDFFSLMWGDSFFMKMIYIPVVFSIIFSMEQIIFGIIGRFIWRKQDPVWEREISK